MDVSTRTCVVWSLSMREDGEDGEDEMFEREKEFKKESGKRLVVSLVVVWSSETDCLCGR